MNAHKPFSILWVLISKRAGIPKGWRFLWPGVSNRGESALLAYGYKGDRLPWQWFLKAAALPWQVESKGGQSLPGGKNPMKPAVSWHTTLFAKSSVLYLWRPWVAERDCSGQEQALSVSHRTGGFCVLPDEKPRSLL